MYVSFNVLREFDLVAQDGKVGHLDDIFFDDTDWRARYLVVNGHGWFSGALRTIPVQACKAIDVANRRIVLDVDAEAVRNSPDLEAHRPISRRREKELVDYFQILPHWEDPQWLDPHFHHAELPPDRAETVPSSKAEPESVDPAAVHLRSAREVEGYRVMARDGEIGHIVDFLIDEHSLGIRHVVVHTGGWLNSRDVIVAPSHALEIEWKLRSVRVDLTRSQVEQGPGYDSHEPLDPEKERSLVEFYRRFISNLT